ncbi:MAG TPA: taurine catabolism dioxygenase TauD [Chromatiales bacterium]|nr:taurine catabolism dioxygenase TauD [Thiotrichales bacterium]HIP68475.1 taurine catabolism dioxygenase TauD [Chromatiales bacterium]
MQTTQSNYPVGSSFNPGNQAGYERWRAEKLNSYPNNNTDVMVSIKDPGNLTQNELEKLQAVCARFNFAIYTTTNKTPVSKDSIRRLCDALGLNRLDRHLYAGEDGISAIQATGNRRQGEYIPYTKHRIRWHTDGYYNQSAQQIKGMVLHCVAPAARGGENMLLDHEIAYIMLRDENPAFIDALMQSDALTIPANIVDGKIIREAVTGPVFSVDPQTGTLHMRYSARQRNIEWKNDATTLAAAEFLQHLWDNPPEYVFHHRLEAGQGLVSNNILHGREAFEDDRGSTTRLLYRARSYDRITGTDTRTEAIANSKIRL